MIFFRKKLISIALATLFFASGAHQLHAAKNSGPRLGLKKLMLLALLHEASANQIHEADVCPASITTDGVDGFDKHTLLSAYSKIEKLTPEETQEFEEKVFFQQSKEKKKQKKMRWWLQNLLRGMEEEEEKVRWEKNQLKLFFEQNKEQLTPEEENRWTFFFQRNNGEEGQKKWKLLLRYIKEKEKRTVQEDLFQLYDWTSQLYDWSKNKSHELATSAAANKTYEQIDRLYTWLKKQLCKSGCRPYDDE